MNHSDLRNKTKLAAIEIIEEKGYLCSIDVLLKLKYLSQKDYENWRFGKVEYLEKVCDVNLKKLTTINKTIQEISHQLGLKKSWTAYNKYGKGKKTRLRFCKSGDKQIEETYATHHLNMKKLKIKHESITKCKCNAGGRGFRAFLPCSTTANPSLTDSGFKIKFGTTPA